MATNADNQKNSVDTLDDFKSPEQQVRRWFMELRVADEEEERWRKSSRYALDRYRGERRTGKGEVTNVNNNFNILYSNTEIMSGAMLDESPRPSVRRRHGNGDDQSKAMSEVLERALTHQIDEGSLYDTEVPEMTEDFLLPGRGVMRVRYLPVTREQTDNDGETLKNEDGEALIELAAQTARLEAVQWDDFRRGPGRKWREVPWIAFKHMTTRDDAIEQFPECKDLLMKAGFSYEPSVKAEKGKDSAEPIPDIMKRLEIWEIWDRREREVVWVCKTVKEKPLAVEDDPLGLRQFFPIPRPALAIKDPDTLVPATLFSQYQVQADHLNELQRRIIKLTKCMKAVGIYDSTLEEVLRLRDMDDGQMVPANSAGTLAERGGLTSAVWFMPIRDMAEVLQALFVAREKSVQEVYEITGISDIMRGATNPNETLGAQQIKAASGGQRFGKLKNEVRRSVRDGVRLMAELIAEKFEPQIIAAMTETPLEEVEKLMPLLKSDVTRSFKIDIETEATEAEQLQQDKAAIAELISAITELLINLGPAVKEGSIPAPFVTKLIAGAAHKFRLGREIDDALEILDKYIEEGGLANGGEEGVPQEQVQQMVQDAFKQGEEAGKDATKIEVEKVKGEADMALRDRDIAGRKEIEKAKSDGNQELERRKLDQADEHFDQEIALKKRELDLREEELENARQERADQNSTDQPSDSDT